MTLFAYPSMGLWLVAPIALWILVLLAARSRRKSMEAFGQLPTVLRMLPAWLTRRRRWITTLRLAALVLWTIALVGPLIGARLSEFKERGLDVFIAVDCSLSMQAQDLPPSRMAHAKLVLGQLVDRLIGSRIGIIAFAGQAYVQCPLTIDQGAAQDALQDLDVGTVPIPGTHIGDAIRVAVQGLKNGEGGHRVLVLLTDGEDHHSDPVGAAKDAARVGMKIFAIGIGGAQGEPIPMYDDQGHRTGYKRDKNGDVVMSRVDESALSQITQLTGGRYFRAESTGNEVEPLVRALNELQQGDQKEKVFNRYENRFQWPLAVGILLFLLSLAIPETASQKSKGKSQKEVVGFFKKAFPSLLPFAFCLLTCRSLSASPGQMKEGNRLFKKGDYADALKLYNDALIDAPNSSTLHFNAGDAAYQSGDFSSADGFFKQAAETAFPALKAAALYNQGNALYREQRMKDAIEAYKAALRVNPQDENAKYNLGIALNAQNQPPPKSSPKNGQGNPKPSGGGNDQKSAQDQNGNQQPNPGEMSREDAERLLSAAGAGEPKKSNQRFAKPDAPHPDEDW